MKPVPLLAYPIKNSTMSNCTALDPFGGSGSTLITCEQTDRICYIIELDKKFCDVIVKRYIEQVGSDDEVTVEREGLTIPYSQLNISNDKGTKQLAITSTQSDVCSNGNSKCYYNTIFKEMANFIMNLATDYL